MKKIKLKTPAKINLTLDVLGVNEEGFHDIRSLVTSIDLYDDITIKKRKDFNVNLKTKGIDPKCSAVDNNAYKSAKKFAKKFKTYGVDLTVDKHIPVGAGLGGSSADIAGVLNGMQALFELNDSVVPIADSLGSDSSYMLKGGWAILNGRGNEQEFIKLDLQLYLIILTIGKGISAKRSYREFDNQNINYAQCTDNALAFLKKGDFGLFAMTAKNDLYLATSALVPQIQENIKALKDAGAPFATMTGSGTAVIGVFDSKKDRDISYKKLKKNYPKNIIKAQTI